MHKSQKKAVIYVVKGSYQKECIDQRELPKNWKLEDLKRSSIKKIL